jgi:tetratricopeptide (TPR) repeat protein
VGLGLLAPVFILTLAYGAFAQGPDPQRLFQDASAAQQRGDAALAVREYQELIRLRPDMIAARANLGLALLSLGRIDEAIAQYRAALAQAPGNPGLRLNLAVAYYKKGDMVEAAREFGSLHEDEPGDIQVATLLGNCYVRLGRTAQAISVLSPLEKTHQDNLDLELALGWALIRAGRTQEGLDRVEKVAQQGHSAEAYMRTAEAQLKLQAFDQARHSVDEAIRLNPNLPGLYTLSGVIMYYAGDQEGSAANFQKALEANPNDFQAQLLLGAVLYTRRDLDAAKLHLGRALEIRPASPLALYEMARVERAQGQVDAAVKDLEKVVGAEPEWIPPHIELTALYYRLKRPEDGAREKQIVDRLSEEQRQHQSKLHTVSPRTP